MKLNELWMGLLAGREAVVMNDKGEGTIRYVPGTGLVDVATGKKTSVTFADDDLGQMVSFAADTRQMLLLNSINQRLANVELTLAEKKPKPTPKPAAKPTPKRPRKKAAKK